MYLAESKASIRILSLVVNSRHGNAVVVTV